MRSINPSDSLKGLRIVVTRPVHQSARLNAMLQAAGGEVISFPTLQILAPDHPELLQAELERLNQYDIAIFTSANAVTNSAKFIKTHWPCLPTQLIFGAVGKGTAEALVEAGLPVTLLPEEQFNSEGLLALSKLQAVTGKSILIVSGEGGRDLLAETLKQRGAKVAKVAAYRRAKPQNAGDYLHPYWQASKISIIISTSNESLQNLFDIVAPEFRQSLLATPLLVISERMVDTAKALGFLIPPVLAENASDEAILAALMAWKETQYE